MVGIIGFADLRFLVCRLVDFFLEGFGDSFALEDAVLAEKKPVLKSELCEREAYNQLLPWE
jgi:hypothetical protein